jgi:hypothetical protein
MSATIPAMNAAIIPCPFLLMNDEKRSTDSARSGMIPKTMPWESHVDWMKSMRIAQADDISMLFIRLALYQ